MKLKDYINIFGIVRRATETNNSLKTKEFDFGKVNKDLKQAWTNYRNVITNDLLKNMPIERLGDVETGMPVNILQQYGLKTISDCQNKSVEYFERFPGIGEVKSRRIVIATDALQRAVFDELDIKIIENSKTNDLLEALYVHKVYQDREKEMKEFNILKNKFTFETQVKMTLANKKKKIFPYLFSKNKEQIDKAIIELENLDINPLTKEFNQLSKYEKPKSMYQDFLDNSVQYYSSLEKTLNVKLDFKNTYLSEELIKKIEETKINTTDLVVSPRAYQYFGAQYIIAQKKTLIGDEMGLGKTIEALIAMNHLYQEDKQKHFIVIAPLSVLTNWKRETEKWTTLKPYVFHGNSRVSNMSLWKEFGGVLITTYGHASMINTNDNIKVSMLVVDEAHYVKNPKAQRSKAIYKLGEEAEYITYMTGTPIENRIGEMVQLISKLHQPIANKLKSNISDFSIRPKTFRKEVAPVYLRRNRHDVLQELPELEEIEHWVPFGEKELIHYKQGIEEGNFMKMRRSAWTGGDIKNSPKLDALVEICHQAKEEGHKVLIFSFFRDVISIIDETLKDRSYGPISGDVSSTRRQEIIDEFTKAEPGSVLVSQIMAGGVGLNIQSANIIIICEPQYKPSTETQAISRSYRMGQNKDVIVYRLLTEESVDERILTMLHGKVDIFNNYAKESDIAKLIKKKENGSEENTIEKIVHLEAERYGLTKDYTNINNFTKSDKPISEKDG